VLHCDREWVRRKLLKTKASQEAVAYTLAGIGFRVLVWLKSLNGEKGYATSKEIGDACKQVAQKSIDAAIGELHIGVEV
jgi:hypothetical protein